MTESKEPSDSSGMEQPAKATDTVPSDAGIDDSYFASASKKTRRELPEWLNHWNARDLKILFKCSLAVWIMTLLIVINPTLRVIGQATFFGCISLFINPPSGTIFFQLLAGFTILLGQALAWAWGTITMKVALATRPQADLNARYAELQQMAQNTTNPGQASGQSTFAQVAIFEGFMLDARVSATYFCMMGLFIYLVSRIRVRAPKLTLISIFATIISDIYICNAPLIPTFNGTIPKLLILPAAIGTGIGLVCNILVFPQSTSSIVLAHTQKVLSPMKGFCGALSWHFKHPGSRMDLDRMHQTRTRIMQGYGELLAAKAFLAVDFTRGRWGPDDINSLAEPLRHVLVAFNELLQIQMSREEHVARDEELQAMEAIYEGNAEDARSRIGHHQISRAVDFRARTRHPDTRGLIEKTLYGLSEASEPLLESCQSTFDALNEAVISSTTGKYDSSRPDKHDAILEKLRSNHVNFTDSCHRLLMEPHAHLFDSNGRLIPPEDENSPPPISGLMVGVLFQERLLNLSNHLQTLLQRIIQLERERSKVRFWLPRSIAKLFHWGLSKDDTPGLPESIPSEDTLTETSETAEEPKKQDLKGDGETAPATPPSAEARLKTMRRASARPRHKTSKVTLGILNWLRNSEGLFALRALIVTIAVGIPAVIPSSAGFYYREKGLWALIMAQLVLVTYSGEFVFGLIGRTLGTVVGGLIGMVCWYIGAGSGDGNPYGMAAIFAVPIVVFMWLRLFLPFVYMQSCMIGAATVYLVGSYSWVDTHIPSYGNPGVGYTVFWRRLLLVLVGFAAAVIVTFIPRPPSGHRHCRKVLSQSLGGIKDRYALLVSMWRNPPSDLNKVAISEGIGAETGSMALADPIKLLKFEFSTSTIDVATLSRVLRLFSSLNRSITQLLIYVPMLAPEARERFMRFSGVNDESVVSEVMAVLTLIQQSLRTGEPLPALLPTPLLQKSFEFRPREVNCPKGPGLGTELMEDAGRKYVSAVGAWVHLLRTIDEMVIVVKKSVGETSDVDIERV